MTNIFLQTTEINIANLSNWLIFPPAFFLLSLTIILWNWQNFIITLLGFELMYFSITSGFIFMGWALNDPKGHIYALLFVVLAAAESAVGLGVLVVLYRFSKSIEFEDYDEMQG